MRGRHDDPGIMATVRCALDGFGPDRRRRRIDLARKETSPCEGEA
jgi:hypothetical protein